MKSNKKLWISIAVVLVLVVVAVISQTQGGLFKGRVMLKPVGTDFAVSQIKVTSQRTNFEITTNFTKTGEAKAFDWSVYLNGTPYTNVDKTIKPEVNDYSFQLIKNDACPVRTDSATVKVKLDPANLIAETNETNNTYTWTFSCGNPSQGIYSPEAPLLPSTGCQYNNPACGQNYDCIDNQCKLKIKSGCLYENPTCNPGDECINNTCITSKKGCFANSAICSSNEYCIRDTCINKQDILPKNALQSQQQCSYDKVYINGKCEKAKFNLIFVQGGLTDEQKFNDWLDKVFAIFIYVSPLKNCPDKIRIHRDFNFCAPKTKSFTQHIVDTIGPNFNSITMLSPPGYKEETNCSASNDLPIGSFLVLEDDIKGVTHEVSHMAGLWDQYCYFPNPKNPVPTDFILGKCGPPKFDWMKSYCSSDGKGQLYDPPYQCEGDPNPFGGISIMGGVTGSFANPSQPTFGFSQKEYDYLKNKFSCD